MHMIRHRPSQTLLEAVLAIGVILVSVFASTTLIITTISAGQSSEDKIVAGNLAREGIEIVRGIRDSNWIKRTQNVAGTSTFVNWDEGLLPNTYIASFSGTAGWSLPPLGASSVVSEKVETVDPNTYNYFTQDCVAPNCTPTKFNREIIITSQSDVIPNFTPPASIEYLNVEVVVTWQNHGNKELTLTERLYDWR